MCDSSDLELRRRSFLSLLRRRINVISGIIVHPKKMFGGKSYNILRGSVSLALVILILFMLTLLVSEDNPPPASLFDL